MANGENGAEREVLEVLASLAFNGGDIHPVFQQVVNLLVAEMVLSDRLPYAKLGRPKADAESMLRHSGIAWEFHDLRDSGVSYEKTMEILVDRHHRSERQLSRIVQLNGSHIPKDKDGRDEQRAFLRMAREMRDAARKEAEARGELYESYADKLLRNLKEIEQRDMARDWWYELQEKISDALDRRSEVATDKKYKAFNVSDPSS